MCITTFLYKKCHSTKVTPNRFFLINIIIIILARKKMAFESKIGKSLIQSPKNLYLPYNEKMSEDLNLVRYLTLGICLGTSSFAGTPSIFFKMSIIPLCYK